MKFISFVSVVRINERGSSSVFPSFPFSRLGFGENLYKIHFPDKCALSVCRGGGTRESGLAAGGRHLVAERSHRLAG